VRSWLVSLVAIVVAIVTWDLAVRISGHTLVPGPFAVLRAIG
jgi:hypothetical protein